MNLPDICSIEAALAIVKRHGYYVSKPRARVVIATATIPVTKLNAVGKPYSPQYDPNWKRKTPLTSIKRLYAPYGQHVRFTQEHVS